MSLSMPTTWNPFELKKRTASAPIRPADPVTMQIFTGLPLKKTWTDYPDSLTRQLCSITERTARIVSISRWDEKPGRKCPARSRHKGFTKKNLRCKEMEMTYAGSG